MFIENLENETGLSENNIITPNSAIGIRRGGLLHIDATRLSRIIFS